jgi:hypothetical protein
MHISLFLGAKLVPVLLSMNTVMHVHAVNLNLKNSIVII